MAGHRSLRDFREALSRCRTPDEVDTELDLLQDSALLSLLLDMTGIAAQTPGFIQGVKRLFSYG